jgi:DNA repair exonuclease SbcCD ATPase subunit
MKIKEATVQNFKGVSIAEFKADGNHVILSGKNGCGKTSVFEALLTALCGKTVMPEDPIRNGKESAIIEIVLSDNDSQKARFKIQTEIELDNFKLKIFPFDEDGLPLKNISAPGEFLKTIITRMSINPQSFFSMKPHEQVQELYRAMPELKDKIEKVNEDYKKAQESRSESLVQKRALESEIKTYPDITDYPTEEKDIASIMNEINEIKKFNSKGVQAKEQLNNIENDIMIINNRIYSKKKEIASMNEEIESFQKKIGKLKDEILSLEEGINKEDFLLNNKIKVKEEIKNDLSTFSFSDDSQIKQKLEVFQEDNRKFAVRKKYTQLIEQLGTMEGHTAELLQKMTDLNEKKVRIFQDCKMPIKGMAVIEDKIKIMMPGTDFYVPINALSTGQKWAVAMAIHSKLNPDFKILFIQSMNDIDKENQKFIFQMAEDRGLQLIIHDTVQEYKDETLSIVIKDSLTGNKVDFKNNEKQTKQIEKEDW